MKLSDRFMKLYHKLFGDEALQLAPAGTIKTLETGRDLAELAPVPGLPVVLDVLITILERGQVSSSCSCQHHDRRSWQREGHQVEWRRRGRTSRSD